MSFGVSLDMTLLFKLPAILDEIVEGAIEETLDETVELAKGFAHKDTTAMSEGTYKVSAKGSTYAEAVSAAKAADPSVGILPEIPAVQKGEGAASNATDRSLWEEFGTVNHGPHSFLAPAALQGEQIFIDKIERKAREKLG